MARKLIVDIVIESKTLSHKKSGRLLHVGRKATVYNTTFAAELDVTVTSRRMTTTGVDRKRPPAFNPGGPEAGCLAGRLPVFRPTRTGTSYVVESDLNGCLEVKYL
jgi:hypothetical protein